MVSSDMYPDVTHSVETSQAKGIDLPTKYISLGEANGTFHRFVQLQGGRKYWSHFGHGLIELTRDKRGCYTQNKR